MFEAKENLQGRLGKPPTEIRSMLSKLETSYHRERLETTANHHLRELPRKTKADYPEPRQTNCFSHLRCTITATQITAKPANWGTTLEFAPTLLVAHVKFLVVIQTASFDAKGSNNVLCRNYGLKPMGLHKYGGSGILVSKFSEDGRLGMLTSGGWDTIFQHFLAQDTAEQSISHSIHTGNMGSGDTVMKSGTHRDQFAEKYDIIAFEMEGVGVWDYFPSLVIKAVCNYADSHKSKRWSHYAAATAAAAKKALLKE